MSSPSEPDSVHATELMNRFGRGDRSAADPLLELIYAELKGLAAGHLRRGAPGTLQPTALVHEAYMRLISKDDLEFDSRRHFFALASSLMRNLIIDHARRKRTENRGGEPLTLSFVEGPDGHAGKTVDVLALHEALEELAELDPERARIVELRFFGGLSHPEIAEVLDVSLRTVERRWRTASGWLQGKLDG